MVISSARGFSDFCHGKGYVAVIVCGVGGRLDSTNIMMTE